MSITKVVGKRIDPTTRKPTVKYKVRVQLPKDPETGRRPSIVRVVGTEREAKQLERKLFREIDTGESVLPDTVTIAELLNQWLDDKRGKVTENSWRDYEGQIRLHLIPALGARKVQSLTATDVRKQLNRWRDAGMSTRMRSACLQRLASALSMAVRDRIVHINVAREVDKPSVGKPNPVYWSKVEAQAFLQQAEAMPVRNRHGDTLRYEPDPLWPLWPVLLLEGLRRGEALGLRWRDIDFDKGEATIIQTVAVDKSKSGAPVIQDRTKTKASKRSVRFTSYTLNELRAHKDRQVFMRRNSDHDWQDLDLVFCTTKPPTRKPSGGDVQPGGPINGNNVTRSFNRIKAETKLPDGKLVRQDVTPHGLRHTCATLMLLAGIHPKVVQEKLGHEGIEITLDLYSHVMPGMQDEAAAAMDEMFRKSE